MKKKPPRYAWRDSRGGYRHVCISMNVSPPKLLPEFILESGFIQFVEWKSAVNTVSSSIQRLAGRLLQQCYRGPGKPMPQEISVSYQAIKSKVYRLIDALLVGEKTEAEVQDSIRRWWDLIHPADRPIAQKYLMAVLARSGSALDAISDGLASVAGSEPAYVHLPSRQLKVMERMIKEAAVRTAV